MRRSREGASTICVCALLGLGGFGKVPGSYMIRLLATPKSRVSAAALAFLILFLISKTAARFVSNVVLSFLWIPRSKAQSTWPSDSDKNPPLSFKTFKTNAAFTAASLLFSGTIPIWKASKLKRIFVKLSAEKALRRELNKRWPPAPFSSESGRRS